MDVAGLCRYRAVSIDPRADLVDAARMMREHHVGFLVVSEDGPPLGVITDRDIVLEAVAAAVDPRAVTVLDAMTRDPVTLAAETPLEEALDSLRIAGVRRAPIVDDGGRLVGVLSVDDVVDHLALQLGAVAGSLRHEQAIERIARP